MKMNKVNMSDLEYLSVPGDIDLEGALKRVRGNWGLLQKLLVSFAKSNRNANEDLDNLLSFNHYEEAQRLAHQIKGASANIGALKLSMLAGDIENTIQAKEYQIPENLIQDFTEQLNIVSDFATHVVENQKPNETVSKCEKVTTITSSAKPIEDCLNQLKKLVRTDLDASNREILKLTNLAGDSRFTSLAGQLATALDTFDVDRVDELIDNYFSQDDEKIKACLRTLKPLLREDLSEANETIQTLANLTICTSYDHLTQKIEEAFSLFDIEAIEDVIDQELKEN